MHKSRCIDAMHHLWHIETNSISSIEIALNTSHHSHRNSISAIAHPQTPFAYTIRWCVHSADDSANFHCWSAKFSTNNCYTVCNEFVKTFPRKKKSHRSTLFTAYTQRVMAFAGTIRLILHTNKCIMNDLMGFLIALQFVLNFVELRLVQISKMFRFLRR